MRPAAAMGEVLDRGSLLFASLAALAVSLLEVWLVPGRVFGFYVPLLVLAGIYVPCLLAIARLFAYPGDYGSLLTCTAMAWTSAQIPLVAAMILLPVEIWLWLTPLVLGYFALLMYFAVRIVFGMAGGAAIAAVVLSFLPMAALPWILPPLGFLLRWVASPFFLFYAWYFLGGELGGLGAGLRSRQHFHRMLEAAAVNSHDGDAQYQLGLIYQQRRHYTEAIERFQRAVEIDPTETDAHFQLGRIAREQGRLEDALRHFQTVAKQDARHSAHEILRELGAVLVTMGHFAEAKRYLEDYVERREYDPEGLYYYGQAMEGSGDRDGARQVYARAVEAARTAPRYRRRVVSRWARLAQRSLK